MTGEARRAREEREMSAERLREAAKVLRELAEAAEPGPWEFNAASSLHDDAAGWVGHDTKGDGFQSFVASTANHPDGLSDGAYIATMHPGVGLALADWLDCQADTTCDCGVDESALVLADLILGGTP